MKNSSFIKAFREGDIFSKISYLIWGLSNIVRGQIVKGLAFLAIEISYIIFMITSGVQNIENLFTLGTQQQGMVYNEAIGIYEIAQGDNSMLFLLYGVATIVVSLMAIAVWFVSVGSGERARVCKENGHPVPKLKDELKALLDKKIYRTFLAISICGDFGIYHYSADIYDSDGLYQL